MPGHLSKVREAFPEVDVILLCRRNRANKVQMLAYTVDIENELISYCTILRGKYVFENMFNSLSRGFESSSCNGDIRALLDNLFKKYPPNFRIIPVNKEKFQQLQQLYTLGKL